MTRTMTMTSFSTQDAAEMTAQAQRKGGEVLSAVAVPASEAESWAALAEGHAETFRRIDAAHPFIVVSVREG